MGTTVVWHRHGRCRRATGYRDCVEAAVDGREASAATIGTLIYVTLDVAPGTKSGGASGQARFVGPPGESGAVSVGKTTI